MAIIKVKTGGVDSTVNLGRRNMIINGDLQVWQRGTQRLGSGFGYLADRIYTYHNYNSANIDAVQSTDVPDGQGFPYSLKVVTNVALPAGQSNFIMHRHYIEYRDIVSLAYGTSAAKELTMSFWIKAPRTGTLTVSILNSADSGSTRHISRQVTISSANTWQKCIINIPGDTAVVPNKSSDDTTTGFFFDIIFNVDAAWASGTLNTSWNTNVSANRAVGQTQFLVDSSDAAYFTGLQLEVGDTATPFEHRSYGEELYLCQRYFTRIYAKGSVQAYNCFPFNGFCRSSTLAQIVVHFNQPMRSVPTMSYSGASDFGVLNATGSTVAVSAINTSRTTENASVADWTSSGLVAGNGTRLLANNTSDPFINADAEL